MHFSIIQLIGMEALNNSALYKIWTDNQAEWMCKVSRKQICALGNTWSWFQRPRYHPSETWSALSPRHRGSFFHFAEMPSSCILTHCGRSQDVIAHHISKHELLASEPRKPQNHISLCHLDRRRLGKWMWTWTEDEIQGKTWAMCARSELFDLLMLHYAAYCIVITCTECIHIWGIFQ